MTTPFSVASRRFALVLSLSLLAGCGGDSPLLAGRSKFFADLGRESSSGRMKSRFERQFSDLQFEVTVSRVERKAEEGKPAKIELSLMLTATNPPGNFKEIRPLLQRALEERLQEWLRAAGGSREGEVFSTMQGEKKIGLWFAYTADGHQGMVRVDDQPYIAGATLITVVEDE